MWEEHNHSYLFAINFNVSNVVFKNRRHIDLWKLVLAEHNEQAGLTTSSISHYDQLFPDCCHSCRENTENSQWFERRELYLTLLEVHCIALRIMHLLPLWETMGGQQPSAVLTQRQTRLKPTPGANYLAFSGTINITAVYDHSVVKQPILGKG